MCNYKKKTTEQDHLILGHRNICCGGGVTWNVETLVARLEIGKNLHIFIPCVEVGKKNVKIANKQ